MVSWTSRLTGSWALDVFMYSSIATIIVPLIVFLYREFFRKKKGDNR